MSRGGVLRFVLPDGVDDPERVSGGNVYDRRVRDGLIARGWTVTTDQVADARGVSDALAAAGPGSTVLIDGLVAGWSPASVESAAATARVIVLAHMVLAAFPDADPRAIEREARALGTATRVIATSAWTASELVRRGIVDAGRVTVALPGAVDGPPARGNAGRLLCVGAIAPHKGQDVLLEALEDLGALDWNCTVAGSRNADPVYAARIAAAAARFDSRVRLTGVLGQAELGAAYQRSGLLVAPSRAESFGMAIADARRRGLPVVASAVGGIPETVAGGGAILVPPGDAAALAAALERWMTDPAMRSRLRAEAAAARARSPRWSATVDRVDGVLRAA